MSKRQKQITHILHMPMTNSSEMLLMNAARSETQRRAPDWPLSREKLLVSKRPVGSYITVKKRGIICDCCYNLCLASVLAMYC